MRSLATISSRPSGRSYRSRTLPEVRCVAPSITGAAVVGMGRGYRAACWASVPDVEGLRTARRRLRHGHVPDRGVRQAATAPLDHGVDGEVLPLEVCRDRAVRLVAHPTGDAE